MFSKIHFFIFSLFRQFGFSDQMTGPIDENERQPSAASSTTTTTPPIVDTDDYIYRQMVRLSPDEEVIRRIRPGKSKFHKLCYIFPLDVSTTLFPSL